METVERVGKTVEDAISDALRILDIPRERAEIKVIDPGNKGFLGLIGNRPARVSVTPIKGSEDVVSKFLQEVFEAMGLSVQISINKKENYLYVDLAGQNMGIIIGKRGQTLDALQYITNLVVNRCGTPEFSVILDTENYRKRRRETLEALALSLARKVRTTNEPVVLEPMNRHERHIIHTMLQRDTGVKTYSDGNEPYRNVVIAPKKG
ncbi:MAG: protein jag [Turicibacter sp.]|nr:protein jag [Turicibacter sp.]